MRLWLRLAHPVGIVMFVFAVPMSGQDGPTRAKLKELASLPTGLVVVHTPNPATALRGGGHGWAYSWRFATTVATTGPDTISITEWGSFGWVDGRWQFRDGSGKPMTPRGFAKWYDCPGARVVPGSDCVDLWNWAGRDTLRAGRSLWYYIGVTPDGRRFKGEATVEELGELDPNDPSVLIAAEGRAPRIAVESFEVPEALVTPGRKQYVESLLAAQLLETGYQVIAPDTTDALRRVAIDSIGGLFDPATGEVDSTKEEAANRILLDLLRTQLGADYLLSPSLVVGLVPFRGSRASWLGATDATGAEGGVSAAFLGTYEGRLPALNLAVEVESLNGREVYRGEAGIRLTKKVVNGQLFVVPRDSLLADSARVMSAFRRVMGGLRQRVPVVTPK